MDNIKTSGDYIAVRVPEISYGYEIYSAKTNGIMFLTAGDQHWESIELPGIYVNQKLEIIGLISDIEPESLHMDLVIAFKIFESEWNQWLIIKKTK